MRIYLKIIFGLMLTISIFLFIYSAYALFAGRAMEKRFANIEKNISNEAISYTHKLTDLYVTDYERRNLLLKYSTDLYIYISDLCYSKSDNPNLEEKTIADIREYNKLCKSKGIPEIGIRPEIEEIFKNWSEFKNPLESEKLEMNSRIYADNSGKGKLDVNWINTSLKFSGIGTIFSFIILFLVFRVTETGTLKKKSKSE